MGVPDITIMIVIMSAAKSRTHTGSYPTCRFPILVSPFSSRRLEGLGSSGYIALTLICGPACVITKHENCSTVLCGKCCLPKRSISREWDCCSQIPSWEDCRYIEHSLKLTRSYLKTEKANDVDIPRLDRTTYASARPTQRKQGFWCIVPLTG